MNKKVLFFRIWNDPPIAKSVEQMLADQFPDYQIEIINIWQRIKKDSPILIINLFHIIWNYWSDFIFKGMKPKAAFFRTEFIFGYVKKMAIKIAESAGKIDFTFQLQSLFDTSIPGIPNFIYTDHTHLANLLYPENSRSVLFSDKWIDLESSIYTNAALIFTRSTDISKSLISQYGISNKKIACVFAGSNIEIPIFGKHEKDYSGQEILFIGMDWKRKGGPVLLDAFLKISEKYPRAVLKIIGCNPKAAHHQVFVLGMLSAEQLSMHYTNATIFCLPSLNEPFGVVFVEAMAHALPIIATSIGAVPEMVREGWNGLIVKPGDSCGLGIALDRLLSDAELRKKFGTNGKKLAEKEYNWTAVGKKIRKAILSHMKEID